MTTPLDGLAVVEFGHYIAAPAATQMLADLGAEVTKIEPPSGDQARSIGAYGEGMVAAFNRGKRSIALDLSAPADHALALALIDRADVVVQNLRAGVLERFGLGPDAMRHRRPALVYVSITAFPTGSAFADRSGLDIVAQAESGMMSINGQAGGEPLRVGFPVADVAASYAVVQAVLAALVRRERTGVGGTAHVSLVEAAVHTQSALWGEWATSGDEPLRKGNGQATAAPAADVVETADGQIVVSAYTTEHFGRLCRLLDKPWMADDPRFADNPSRVEHRDALLAEIGDVLGSRTTADCVDWLSRHGIVVAAIRRYSDVLEATDIFGGALTTGIDEHGRRFTVPALPFALDGVAPEPDRKVPVLGEHETVVRGEP